MTFPVGSLVTPAIDISPVGCVESHTADGWPEVRWPDGRLEAEAPEDLETATLEG